MGRGREPLVSCEKCKRRVPRDKAVTSRKGLNFDLGEQQDVVMDMSGQAAGVCGSHNGIRWTYNEGLSGIVLDGSIRDTYEANLEGIKAFCTRRTFNHPYHRIELADVNIPIQCGGVRVEPGDIITADDDGVLVIPREYIARVLYLAEIILDRDQQARAKSYRDAGLNPDETLGPYKDDAHQ